MANISYLNFFLIRITDKEKNTIKYTQDLNKTKILKHF